MRQKLARTLNFAIWGRLKNEERETFTEYFPKHLFNYDKGHRDDPPGMTEPFNLSERKVRRDFLIELGKVE